MLRGITSTLCISLFFISVVNASDDLDQIDDLLQSEFELLSEDLGSVLAYRSVSPAEPLGTVGFDIGVSVSATKLENTDVWETAVGSNDADSTLYMPKLHVAKGLPLGIDVGAFYTSVPNTNIKYWGGEVKYAIWEGGTATPALAVRGSHTRLAGVDQLSVSTTGLDLSISKGLAMLTPYAGIGVHRVNSDPQEEAATVLKKETFTQSRLFAGVNISLALLNTVLEFDKTGDATSYTVKFGLRF